MFEQQIANFSPLLERCYPSLNLELFCKMSEKLYAKHRELNQVHNLTSIATAEEFFEKHVVDSLMIALVVPEVFTQNLRIADIGCGGGFPCLPLAAVNPQIKIDGFESLSKKVDAVNEIAKFCGFDHVHVHALRAREAALKVEFHKQFDIVTARAVATVDVLIKECRQFLKSDGRMVFYKTPEAIRRELPLASRDAAKHGLKLTVSDVFLLSPESGERQFFILQKGN